ncbi:ThiF family adenylyltransferase [Pseudomonas argentinensis]|uniref:ThiF family adenylyltransferase n=1 Tax=Phytopseudomonas argentinensis TaxID=289370 RepID=UPI0008A8E0BC|nr:ThiF family adenylyltransferase [Pseudomonas argentinensis]
MEQLPEVLRHMVAWGFTKVDPQPHGDWIVMNGGLPTATQGNVPCDVWIDRTHQRVPMVRLTRLPDHLPGLVPHLGPSGFLCYSAPGTEVVDIFDPVEQTRTSLLQAAHVLEQILAGGMVEDLQEEFFAFWQGASCFHDVERRSSGSLKMLRLSDSGMFVITDDDERSRLKFARSGRTIGDFSSQLVMLTSTAAPRPLQEYWPPENVDQILAWQGKLDGACRRKIYDKIVDAYRERWNAIAFVIESKKTGYSYGFMVYELQRNRPPGQAYTDQGLPIFDCPVQPLEMVRVDDKYLCQRNIPKQATFIGKRIALIGCGTIGGFLAEMLMKAGAGLGGGELLLIDNDSLAPQNLGRHRLGFNRLFLPKSSALASELKVSMPALNVKAFEVKAQEVNLSGVDLVIDATGEEAFGHWLAKAISSPLLHVWIEGAGVAVRALTRFEARQGCYRCLTDHNHEGALISVEGGLEPIFAGQGCEGLYVPFPASVSIQAAALALDSALAWVGAKAWPSLSTRVVDTSYELLTQDCSPLKRPGCPACSS